MLKNVETIGARIYVAIHSSGKTPTDIHNELGMPKSYISKAINNKINRPLKFIRSLSIHLGISESWLLTGHDDPYEQIPKRKGTRINVVNVNVHVHVQDDSNFVYLETKFFNENGVECYTGISNFNISMNDIVIVITCHEGGYGNYLAKLGDRYEIISKLQINNNDIWYRMDKLHAVAIQIVDYQLIGKIIEVFSQSINSIRKGV